MTIKEFLESPSSSFEDVTDSILAPGGAKKETTGATVGGDGEVQEEPPAVSTDVDSSPTLLKTEEPLVVDSAAEAVQDDEVDIQVDTPVSTPPVVESPPAVEQGPEPRRRRRRR